MNKYTLCMIATSITLALTACSSSHGGDEINQSNYLTEKPSTSNPQAENKDSQTTAKTDQSTPPSNEKEEKSNTNSTISPETVTPEKNTSNAPINTVSPFKDPLFIPSDNGPLVGAVMTLKSNDQIVSNNPINNGKEELNELIIGDHTFLLFNSRDLINGNGMDGFKTLSNDDVMQETPLNGKVSGYVGGWGSESELDPSIFTNMRFGVMNINNESTLFVQGYQTPENGINTVRGKTLYSVPKEGKYLYHTGHALYGENNSYKPLEAEVVADFKNKQLEVALKENNIIKLEFTSEIKGNSFSGNNNGIESKGAFYGSQGNEVGGIFYQTEGAEKGKNGVFGAVDKRFIRE